MRKKSRIGFISTRLSGTDGVSLETAKWVKVLKGMGHECFFLAGESEWPEENSLVVPEAHFAHPDIRALNVDLFDDFVRFSETTQKIDRLKQHLKQQLYRFKDRFNPQVLVVENALSLPMNVPLGLAISEFIAETDIHTVAHHHDFTWERQRYAVTAADDYLRAAFPPTLHAIRHVVINSFAERQLALRTGISSMLIPNVMDFDSPPPEKDGYADDLRERLRIPPEAYLLLQPTRIVSRKRIERAIELARRLDLACALVITHHSGDEGQAYEAYLHDYARLLDVKVHFAAEFFAPRRHQGPDGQRIYSLADAYQYADLVTYPSRVEGFGNAFLETIYFRRPILMSNYEIFKTDIQPKGFKIVSFDDYISSDCVQNTRHLLQHPGEIEAMVAHNYELGRQYYSFRMLEARLDFLMKEALGYG